MFYHLQTQHCKIIKQRKRLIGESTQTGKALVGMAGLILLFSNSKMCILTSQF